MAKICSNSSIDCYLLTSYCSGGSKIFNSKIFNEFLFSELQNGKSFIIFFRCTDCCPLFQLYSSISLQKSEIFSKNDQNEENEETFLFSNELPFIPGKNSYFSRNTEDMQNSPLLKSLNPNHFITRNLKFEADKFFWAKIKPKDEDPDVETLAIETVSGTNDPIIISKGRFSNTGRIVVLNFWPFSDQTSVFGGWRFGGKEIINNSIIWACKQEYEENEEESAV